MHGTRRRCTLRGTVRRIASFVLVHGAWGGGWEWQEVAGALRDLGDAARTPTLTGMGERAHLGGPDVGVETHIADLVSSLEHEGPDDVVLCGHSYGGIPVTGAADRCPDRIRLVVYVDALVPRDGQSAFDLLPASFEEAARASAAAEGDGWRVSVPPYLHPPTGWVSEEARDHYIARVGPHPLASLADPVRLTGAVDLLPRAFVRCTAADLAETTPGDPIAPMAARAQAEGWLYRELDAPHDPQLADPVGVAAILHELGRAQ